MSGSIIYLSHGGGPLPLLNDPGHAHMIEFMRKLPEHIERPREILVVSAHWEEEHPTVISSGFPKLEYDYYGFPQETYEITYPAPGSPRLAERICSLLHESHIPCEATEHRGFDHGLFIPLYMMYPDADIPVTQLSLVTGLNPSEHIALGRALRQLIDGNTLVIGSGFSFHNMHQLLSGTEESADPKNDAFQDWLIDVCTGSYDEDERSALLNSWEAAPGARYCHPREEHLLPLHVCFGMSGGPAECVFDDHIMGKRAVAFTWQQH